MNLTPIEITIPDAPLECRHSHRPPIGTGWSVSIALHVAVLGSMFLFDFHVPEIGSRRTNASSASIEGVLAQQHESRPLEMSFVPQPAAPLPPSDVSDEHVSFSPDAPASDRMPSFMTDNPKINPEVHGAATNPRPPVELPPTIITATAMKDAPAQEEDQKTIQLDIKPELVSEGGAASSAQTEVTEQPAAIFKPPVVYPSEALRQGAQGRIVIRVAISKEGVVTDLEIATSSGSEVLDNAAIKWVKQWRFQPARSFGVAVATRVRVPVRFTTRR